MKKILGIIIFSLVTSFSFSQECDSLVNVCYSHLKNDFRKSHIITVISNKKAFNKE